MRNHVGAILLAVASTAIAVEPAGTPLIRYGEPVNCGLLKNPVLIESSGIVAGRRNPRVLWTHNDSGDTARFFAINDKGEDLGIWNIPGLTPQDWEDIATVKIDEVDHMVLCDVGDNNHNRKGGALYFVPEPQIDPEARGQRGDLRVTLTLRFKYEGGPRDCEAVFVDPIDQAIVLITKEVQGRCAVYALPLTNDPGVKVANRIADISIKLVTSADVSPDGRRAILVTYGSAFEFHRAQGEKWGDVFARPPRVLKMPPRKLGESICYDADGVTLFLTSEGKGEPLWKVPVVSPAAAPGK